MGARLTLGKTTTLYQRVLNPQIDAHLLDDVHPILSARGQNYSVSGVQPISASRPQHLRTTSASPSTMRSVQYPFPERLWTLQRFGLTLERYNHAYNHALVQPLLIILWGHSERSSRHRSSIDNKVEAFSAGNTCIILQRAALVISSACRCVQANSTASSAATKDGGLEREGNSAPGGQPA